MQLQLSTWQEVDAYLTRSQTIILPFGSTEQHGPTGLIGTDALCPAAIAEAVGEATGTLIGPTFAIGMAQHHMGFAGTMTLRPSTIIAMVHDAVSSLALHGFRRFYFLNGHGGNIATLSTAFSAFHAELSLDPDQTESPDIRLKQRNWWDGSRFRALSAEYYGAAEGTHATCSEISLSNYLYPDHVKSAVLDPEIAPRGPILDAADFRRRFPDGRMGSNPSLCSVAHGKRIFEAARDDVIDDLSQSFRD